jgi:hypothetical protein
LTDLTFNELWSYIKEKLVAHNFVLVNQVLERASVQENRTKYLAKSKFDHSNIHFLSNDSDASDNESSDVYVVEFVWSSKDKPHTCASLKPIHRN